MRSAPARPLLASRVARTGVAFLALIALAFLQARLLAIYGPAPPRRVTLLGVPYFLLVFNTLWALLYPLVDWTSVRLLSARRGVAIVLHLAAGALVALGQIGVLYALSRASRWLGMSLYWPGKDSLLELTADFAYYNLLLYALLAAVASLRQLGARLREGTLRAAQLDTALAEAQLAGLRLQLQPHFLFNALNTLSGYVTADPEKAVEMIERLSALLRTSLRSEPEAEAPLGVDIGLAEQYLEIERLRFPDRLRVRVGADPEARRCLVPSLLLLPLVENAVRHGISRTTGVGTIEIDARCLDDRLHVAIRDNGPGPGDRASREENWGIGLRNTRDRLRRAYGSRATLDLSGRPEGGTEVRIVLPIDTAGSGSVVT